MNSSEFPIQNPGERTHELDLRRENRPTIYRHPLAHPVETNASQGYDNILDYWHILYRHRKTLLSFAVVGLVGALAISVIETPVYRVRTSLEIQSPNIPEPMNANEPSASGAASEAYIETQVKLLQSESLLEDVVDKLKLHQRPTTGWRSIGLHLRNFFKPKSSSLSEREEIIRQIERNLTVRTSGNSHLLEVLYESPDPQGAADFANTLVSEFVELSQESRWKAAEGTAEWLTKHLNLMKSQLEQSEAQLQDYARTSGLTFTSEKDNLAENKLKQLQDELSKAQADRITNQARFEGAKSKPADSLPEVSQDQTMREYRQRLTELQRQYAELAATLTPEHYKVQRVQAQITELQNAIQKERDTVKRRIGSEYSESVRRENLLAKAHDQQEKIVADQSEKAIHYDTLKRDVDSNRRLYETMLQRVKEASLATAMRDSNVLVVDRAKAPARPYRPSYPMNAAIGLFGGVLLGFGFVLFRERVDKRISVPDDAQIYLDLPVLGVIPLDEGALHIGTRLPGASLPAGRTSRAPGDCPELATWKRKPSLLAECTRTTLTSILLPNQGEDALHVIVLTSPSQGDGKTTVACNLSIAMAEIGRRVLLIEGDLRRPRLHRVFGIANNWGLRETLQSEVPLETVPLSHLVHATEVAGLSLLPGGTMGATPANLFYSSRMSALLKRLRREFDMILIDAPPMIHLADARLLGRLADGVILVVRAGQTTTDSALFAAQRFAEDGTRVLGTVLNSWDPRSGQHYGYGSYQDHNVYAGH